MYVVVCPIDIGRIVTMRLFCHAASLLLLFVRLNLVEGFQVCPKVGHGKNSPRCASMARNNNRNRTVRRVTLRLYYENETGHSEWYGSAPSSRRRKKPCIQEIYSPQDYEELVQNNTNGLVVVKIYASWCKSCQRFGLSYKKLATKLSDVTFTAMEWTENRRLCKSLGVSKLPHVQAYYHGRRVADFVCGPADFYKVTETIDRLQSFTHDQLMHEAYAIQEIRNDERGESDTGVSCNDTIDPDDCQPFQQNKK